MKPLYKEVSILGFDELYNAARSKLNTTRTTRNGKMGHVAAALLTDKGNVYTGVALDLPSSIGFCAEHNAISTMVTQGEYRVDKIIAVYESGNVLPPCGRCRELISQVGDSNYNCEIGLPDRRVAKLKDLLPERWDARYLQ
ncbi:cytidine deaminase family protein [Salinicoccus albus]|uniref:cytidine deaminase family protein n=1 Tax=Salinicoccus albus TaxID=418756 RepID=UPI0009FD3629|nr:cytidine deaminase [Salinicoccus albus]